MINILLGVSGSISAYKVCSIISSFNKLNEINSEKDRFNIKVVMTKNATKFITPLTLETLSQNPVMVDMWDESNAIINHIDLAQEWADVFVVAPATASIIGKFANGIADDLLSTLFLASVGPIIVAPAMNTHMYKNPIMERNIEKLKEQLTNIQFIDPVRKKLACRVLGTGALASTETIVSKILIACGGGG